MIACGFVISSPKGDGNIWTNGRAGEYLIGQPITKSAQGNSNAILVSSGCFTAIRTKFLKESGGFDERTMAEDMDLTWKAIESGYDVAFVEDAICVVSDPENAAVYFDQVSRWYRGFFQCILARNGNLFKRWRLGIVAYSYMAANVLGIPAYIYALVTFPIFTLLSAAAIYIFFTIWCAFMNFKTALPMLQSPKQAFSMIVLSFYNYYIVMHAFYKEVIMRDRLNVWIKGH